jgi:putative PIN family toxin of toxin-antitoxin system
MRVVIDTNVLVSALLSPRNTPGRILRLFEQQAFELLISEEIFQEYAVALHYDRLRKRHKLTNEQLIQLLQDLRSSAIFVKPSIRLNIVASDPDDNKFFECALEGSAHFIVSGDSAVQAVKQYQGIQVLSPPVFLALFEQLES